MIDQSAIIETMTGLVLFEIADQEFCADIRDISAIVNPAELNQKENLGMNDNPHVVINNLNIPIVPLHKFFSVELNEKTEDQRILIIEPDNSMFGFFVDRVKEIFTMSKEFKDKLTFVPRTSDKVEEYLTGTINFEGRTLLLPDFQRLLLNSNK
jgi:chemotaxis signal transduction protein